MKKILDLMGFYNPPVPSSDAITFEMFCSGAIGLESKLSESGQVKRAFHLMKRNNTSRTITHEEFREFLISCGIDVSEDHAERITEIISHNGDDFFTEQELVDYVAEFQLAQARKRKNEAKKKAAAGAAGK